MKPRHVGIADSEGFLSFVPVYVVPHLPRLLLLDQDALLDSLAVVAQKWKPGTSHAPFDAYSAGGDSHKPARALCGHRSLLLGGWLQWDR